MFEPELVEQAHGDYLISTDRTRLDLDRVHRALSEDAYWSLGRERAVVERSFANTALVCGAYDADGRTVGFARMVTDGATFGWLCDVWLDPTHRGHGLGVAIVRTIVEHPSVVGIKRQILATADAHELYRRFGYDDLDEPSRWMMRTTPEG